MDADATVITVRQLMLAFAARTGLFPPSPTPRRYLWTDAFAVCNFLALYSRTRDRTYFDLAESLAGQVHRTLGRFRDDDRRSGWISGLDEEEGEHHPARGGLRIGKQLPERLPDEPFDERLEWERDGQYFHYLTRWMHALVCLSRARGDRKGIDLARELAGGIFPRFIRRYPDGTARLYWKMSTDLSRPLIASMGQHDPLDGYLTFRDICMAAEADRHGCLGDEIRELAAICRQVDLATDDPLGLGGLLTDAHRAARMVITGDSGLIPLLERILSATLPGTGFAASALAMPSRYRLPFRELGLSIGLHSLLPLRGMVRENREIFGSRVLHLIDSCERFLPLASQIENYWLDPVNRQGGTWTDHEDINAVMLATSLAPEGYLLC